MQSEEAVRQMRTIIAAMCHSNPTKRARWLEALDWVLKDDSAIEREACSKQTERLTDAVNWAYQAIGARWPNEEALDNLSAVSQGQDPPHPWPLVPLETENDATSGTHIVGEVQRQKSG